MKKICPYCGRIDNLGIPCKGCGYVLRDSDKDSPESPFPQNPKTIFPSEERIPIPSDKGIQRAKETESRLEAHRTNIHRKNSVHMNFLKPAGVILGILILWFGAQGFLRSLRFYHSGDALNGIVGNTFAISMMICGLSCFQFFRIRFWKYAKSALIVCLLISFGIPLFLLFL